MPAPTYVSQQSSNGIGQQIIPDYGAGEATAAGMRKFAGALQEAGQEFQSVSRLYEDVNRATTLAERQTRYLEGADKIDQEFQNDPDPSTMPKRIEERIRSLENDALQGLDPKTQAEFQTTLTRQRLSAVGRARQSALGQQQDRYNAALDGTYDSLTRRYATAGSDVERKAAAAELDEALNNGVGRGVITQTQAEKYRQSLAKTGDEALILRQMARDPASVAKAMDDPEQFPGIADPVARERLKQQAQAADEEQRAQMELQRARMDPVRAVAQLGIVTDLSQGSAIYDRALGTADPGGRAGFVMRRLQEAGYTPAQAAAMAGGLGWESGGFNTKARNPGDGRDGSDSIGLAQWNAERARALKAFAAASGRDPFAFETQVDFVIHELNTTERAQGQRLRDAQSIEQAASAAIGYFRPKGWSPGNPSGGMHFAERLGLARKYLSGGASEASPQDRLKFQENLKQFDGYVPAAIAAQTGDPAAAAKALEQARAAHGNMPTPAQYLAFLPEQQRAKVETAYSRLTADPAAPGYSPQMTWRVATGINNELERQSAAQARTLDSLVSIAGRSADEFRPLLEQGYAVNPQQVADIRAPLELAAARGDAAAADKLRGFNEAMTMAPIVRQAYSQPPMTVMAEAAAGRAILAASPSPTPEMARRVQVFERVAQEMNTAVQSDSIGLAMRQGIVPAGVVQPQANLADPQQAEAFRQQANARGIASDQTAKTYGARHFFRDGAERDQWKAAFAERTGAERFEVIANLASAGLSEPALQAAVKEMGGDALSMTAARLVATRPDVARDVMIGGDILKDDLVRPKIDKIKPALDAKLGALPYPNPTWKSDIANAALAVYAAERGRNGALYSDADEEGMTAAIERVTGEIASLNGVKVPLPPGMSAGALSSVMFNLTSADLEPFGGAYGRGGVPLPIADIRSQARLTPLDIGRGRFAVQLPSGPVMTKDGKALTIDLPALQKGVAVRDQRALVSDENLGASILEDATALPGEPGYERYQRFLRGEKQ